MDEKDFLQRALKAYDNPQCISVDEFKADLDRLSHIKRLLTKYQDGSGPANERLVLNHLVICFNIFSETTVDLIFHKLEEHQWGIIIPFLLILRICISCSAKSSLFNSLLTKLEFL